MKDIDKTAGSGEHQSRPDSYVLSESDNRFGERWRRVVYDRKSVLFPLKRHDEFAHIQTGHRSEPGGIPRSVACIHRVVNQVSET